MSKFLTSSSVAIVLSISFLLSSPISADTSDGNDGPTKTNVTINLTIKDGCTFGFDSDVDFGQVPLLNQPLPATSTFTIKCSSAYVGDGVTIPVQLNAGAVNPDDNTDNRYLYFEGKNGDDKLAMNIYREPSHQTVWGESASNQYYAIIAKGQTSVRARFYLQLLKQKITKLPEGQYSNIFHATVLYPSQSDG